MATERDVYEIDASGAEEALKKVANEFEKLDAELQKTVKGGKETRGVFEEMSRLFKEDLTQSLFSAQAAYDMLKQSVQAVAHFVLDGVAAFAEQEKAQLKLGLALRNVGGASQELVARLNTQTQALERLTGIDGDYLTSLQAMLTTMGVAPEQLERFTQAAVNLATATGQDAKVAAQLLARANAEGKEELKKYGIEVDEVAVKSKGFAAVLEQVELRYGGIAEQQPEIIRQTNELKGAWDDFQKSVGGAALRLVETKDGANGLAKALDWLTEKIQNANVKSIALKGALTGLINPFLAVPGLLAAGEELATTKVPEQPNVADLRPDFTAGPPVTHLPGFEPKTDKQIQEAETERKRRHAEALRDAKKYREDMERISAESKANLSRMERDEDDATRKRIIDSNNWEKQAEEERIRQNYQFAQDQIAILKDEEEARQRLLDARLEKERQFWTDIRREAMGALQGLVSAQFQFLSEMLTANTEYNRQMFELELQRRTAGKAEEEVQAERTKMEKQLADERGAAYLKMTADALASIAQQAAVKAVMEGVEAIAALAVGNVPGAALHGAAAAGYAGVAVLAGGTAAVMSSARGMTTDERKQLESARNADKERAAKEKQQAAERKGEVVAGTVVNVYNLGITGATEVEQAKELERIRMKYNDLRTGSK